MHRRTRIAAVVGGIAMAGSLALGVGDASAWKSGGGHPATGSVTDKVPSVSLKNDRTKAATCMTILFPIEKLPQVKTLVKVWDKQMGDPAFDMDDLDGLTKSEIGGLSELAAGHTARAARVSRSRG